MLAEFLISTTADRGLSSLRGFAKVLVCGIVDGIDPFIMINIKSEMYDVGQGIER